MLHSVLLGLWLPFLFFRHRSVSGEQVPLVHQARLRNATLDDADAIAEIFIAAFDPMPDWQYIYPFRHEFPSDHKRCYRSGIMRLLSKTAAHAEVIEGPSGSPLALVAAAIWVQDDLQARFDVLRRASKCMYKAMNITRAFDYEIKFNTAKRKHVDEVFGTSQLYLEQLGTHPDYQARGAGTQLLLSGLERGRKAGVNVSLLAQPTAESFYLHRGFREVNNISIGSADGDQTFEYNVMLRPPVM